MTAIMTPRDSKGYYRLLIGLLSEYVPESVARGIIGHALARTGVTEKSLELGSLSPRLLEALYKGVDLFLDAPARKQECKDRICVLTSMGHQPQAKTAAETTIRIDTENDIVTARNQARYLAEDLGFSKTDQIKIATAVSELARNIYKYAGQGSIQLQPQAVPRHGLKIMAQDRGKGIANLEEIMSGGYRSKTGLGLGILGCKRLMDEFNIETGPGQGTRIMLVKLN